MKALIFDLDGTLLDTLEDLMDATNYALDHYGFPRRNLDEIRSFVGNGLRKLIARAMPEGTDEDTVTEGLLLLKSYYLEHYHDRTHPYEGVQDMLAVLKKEGYQMAVVSNKADPMVQLLRELFFKDLVHTAVGERDNVQRKPAPDMVHLAMKELGVTDAVYIGDSDVDIQTAGNSGLPCLSVGWGFRSEEELHAAGAVNVYHSPAQLLDAIHAL